MKGLCDESLKGKTPSLQCSTLIVTLMVTLHCRLHRYMPDAYCHTCFALSEHFSPCFQVQPDQYSVFDIYVRSGYRPTVSTFDTRIRLPDGSCTELSYNSTDGCNASAYKVQLLDGVIEKPGTYFLGVHYEGSSEVKKRRRRRDYDPRTDINYAMSVIQEQCLSWKNTEEQWSSHGCRVSFIFCCFVLPATCKGFNYAGAPAAKARERILIPKKIW